MKILVIDVGGTNIKLLATGRKKAVKLPSSAKMTARQMVRAVQKAAAGWEYSAVSMGYPGVVRKGRPAVNPRNLGKGWVGFDFAKAFGCPVKVLNDAAMQALGSYTGGSMLFLGLGTGLGTALVIEGIVHPMEIAHLPYKKGRTYEQFVGKPGLARLGKKKWRRRVADVIERFKTSLLVDYVVVGGGNAKLLRRLPRHVRRGDNDNAFVGGYRLWDAARDSSGSATARRRVKRSVS